MKASDCKVGDWLVIQDRNSGETRIHTPTIAKVVSVATCMVTVSFAKHTRWDLLESEDGVLYSNNWMGEPAIPLDPTGFDTYKDRCHVITKDHEFDVTCEVGEEIAKHYGFEPVKTQEKMKLRIGDKFKITNEMASRKSTSPYGGNIWHLVGKIVEVTSVGSHSTNGGFYQAGMPDGMAMFTIRSKDVDPYLPSQEAEKVNWKYKPRPWHTVPDDAPSDMMIKGKKEDEWTYRHSGSGIATTNAPWPGGVRIDFKSMESHMEGGVKVHDDVELKSVYIPKIEVGEVVTLTQEMVDGLHLKNWGRYIGKDMRVLHSPAFTYYNLFMNIGNNTTNQEWVDTIKFDKYLFSKPSFMTRLFNKVKRLTMSKTDKQLVDKGLMNLDGDPTEQGIELMQLVQWNEYKEKVAELNRQLIAEEPKKECDCECG